MALINVTSMIGKFVLSRSSRLIKSSICVSTVVGDFRETSNNQRHEFVYDFNIVTGKLLLAAEAVF